MDAADAPPHRAALGGAASAGAMGGVSRRPSDATDVLLRLARPGGFSPAAGTTGGGASAPGAPVPPPAFSAATGGVSERPSDVRPRMARWGSFSPVMGSNAETSAPSAPVLAPASSAATGSVSWSSTDAADAPPHSTALGGATCAGATGGICGSSSTATDVRPGPVSSGAEGHGVIWAGGPGKCPVHLPPVSTPPFVGGRSSAWSPGQISCPAGFSSSAPSWLSAPQGLQRCPGWVSVRSSSPD